MNAVLAYQPEYEEVTVVSIEVLDANVSAMHGELSEFKTDFKEHRKDFNAAIARLDNDIKAAVSELRAEIRAVAAKAARDLETFSDRVESQFAAMRADFRVLNDKVDSNFNTLNAKIDSNFNTLSARVDVTNEKLTELGKSFNHLDNKLNAMFWVIGGLIAVATFLITVGNAVGWF